MLDDLCATLPASLSLARPTCAGVVSDEVEASLPCAVLRQRRLVAAAKCPNPSLLNGPLLFTIVRSCAGVVATLSLEVMARKGGHMVKDADKAVTWERKRRSRG